MAKRRLSRTKRAAVAAEACSEMLEEAVEACLFGNTIGARQRLAQARAEGCLVGRFAGLSGCRDARGEFVPSPACRGFRAPSGGRKAKGKKACPHGRVTRGARKGQCRKHPKR